MIIYSTFRFNLVLLINQRTQEQCSIFIGGQCHKIFSYYIYIPNRGNISVCKNVCSVIDTAESSSARSVVSVSQAQQCPWYRWVKLSEVLDIGESSSAVYEFCIYFFIAFFLSNWKRQFHTKFRPCFVNASNSIGPKIHGQEYLCVKVRELFIVKTSGCL